MSMPSLPPWPQPGDPGLAGPVLEPAGSAGTTPRLIADILIRQRSVLLATVGVCVAVASAWVLLVTPLYEGASSVRIDREQMTLPMPMQRLTGDSEISTEIEVLKSRTLAEDAVRSFHLQVTMRTPKLERPSALLGNLQVADDVSPRTIAIRSREEGGYEVVDGRRKIEAEAGSTVKLEGVVFDLPMGDGPAKIEFEVRPMSKALRQFRSDVAVTRAAREANIVVVRYRTPDPELAAEVPNFVVGSFIERRQTLQQSQSGVTVDFLREQIARLGADLTRAEEQLQSYRERNDVVSLVAEATTQVARLAEVEAERDALAAERSALAKLMAEIEGEASLAADGGDAPYRRLLAFPSLLRDQASAELLRSLIALENERAVLLTRRSPDDPDVQIQTARLATLETQVRSVGATYLDGLNDQLAAVDATLNGYRAQLGSVPEKEIQVARLERTPKVLGELHALLQTRLKEAEIKQAAEDPSVYVVDRAVMPHEPVRPKPAGTLFGGLAVGLLLGVSLALGREYTDRKVRSRSDLQSITGHAVLSLIPRVSRGSAVPMAPSAPHRLAEPTASSNGNGAGAPGRIGGNRAHRNGKAASGGNGKAAPRKRIAAGTKAIPASTGVAAATARPEATVRRRQWGSGTASGEAFDHLTTTLSYLATQRTLKSLVVTSAVSGDGKSTTAMNSALAMARRGANVLLVDADLRRGTLNQLLGAERAPGLADVLCGHATLGEAIQVVEMEQGSIHFLSTGLLPHNPPALIGSELTRALIAELEQSFEIVILDTPPVNVVTDAAILGPMCDGVLMVVRSGTTETEAVRFAMERLQSVQAPMIGSVLNDIDLGRDQAYDRSYEYLIDNRYYAVNN